MLSINAKYMLKMLKKMLKNAKYMLKIVKNAKNYVKNAKKMLNWRKIIRLFEEHELEKQI